MKKYLLLAIGLLVSLPLYAKTVETRLENGMKIIVQEDHRAPVVTSQVWYRIGSTYEHDGITGVSHVLEHMMFKGTKNHKTGEFSRIISANGGRENAFTSAEYTAYHQLIASDRLEVCFNLEADRMRNLLFDPKEYKKEVQVVIEERRMRVDNKPKSKLYEQFNATAFLNSPQRIPTIGWGGDLDNLKLEDAKAWYQKWYAPNNATLVVVGDVDPQAVIKLAKKYFGPLKPSKIELPKPRPEIVQQGERRLDLYGQTASPYILMGYKTPTMLEHPELKKDVFALDVLSAVLDGGSSARISKHMLRGSEIAVSAGTSFGTFDRLPGLFIFSAIPSKGVKPAQLEAAFKKEINDLQQTPVSEKELERVKAQVIASKVFERDSIFYSAMQIGMLEAMGFDWHELDSYVDNIRAITAADVQRVAKKYFNDKKLTVATPWPESK